MRRLTFHAFYPAIFWRKGLHPCAILVTIVVLTYFYFVASNDRTAPIITLAERNMFADEAAARVYRRSCAGKWQDMISAWEKRQLLALSGDTSVPLVVYRCHDVCGGLGDRQRGILTSFLLAVVTARGFMIDNEKPVPMRHYFHVANPGLHWVFDTALLTNRSVLEESFMDAYPAIGDYAEANLSYYDAYDVVIQKNNFWKPLSILQNPAVQRWEILQSYDEHTLAGCVLNYLLVPERHLVMRVQRTIELQAQLDKRILAVQIRSGDNQAKNVTVIDDLAAIFLECIQKVQNESDTEFAVFVTSDSDEVAARIMSAFPQVLSFPGPILHLDGYFGKSESPDAAFQKVLMDHIMLSSAAELVISRSGFAEFASLRGFKYYRHPHSCGKSMHYSFPQAIPAGVPAGQLNSVTDILRPSFEGREV